MVQERIPRFVLDGRGQSMRDVLGATEQRFLFGGLAFVLNPELRRIAITRAYEGGSNALATRPSSEITLFYRQQEENYWDKLRLT